MVILLRKKELLVRRCRGLPFTFQAKASHLIAFSTGTFSYFIKTFQAKASHLIAFSTGYEPKALKLLTFEVYSVLQA